MKRIENEDGRLITFSKRRSGIYKKASELVTLCGAEYTPLVEAYRKLRINELNQNCNELLSRLEAEKERGNMLKQMMKGKGRRQQQQSYWWEAPVDELNFQDLHQMYAMLEDLHSNLCRKINGPSSSRNPLFACTNHQNDPAGSFPHGFDYGRRHF
ncbi:hypothetical protein GH714_028388 [Hevea brasiliensis]|uniref:MADS-box domain-containing protein n=1 Tax=Hevea brasiliensis TaxID=3981 RepID=A0A6A6MRZ5_HEVBR|nr:hypothetical protein GH714_028388 [Hevea brasiliensis]